MLEGDPTARVTRAAPTGRVALDGAASSPRPKERVPLYVAGDHPVSIDLAAKEGDGWIAPVTTFAAGATRLREEERRSGRAAGSVSAVVMQELGKTRRSQKRRSAAVLTLGFWRNERRVPTRRSSRSEMRATLLHFLR